MKIMKLMIAYQLIEWAIKLLNVGEAPRLSLAVCGLELLNKIDKLVGKNADRL